MPLVISTAWNSGGRKSAARMLFEIERLGFKNIELSFNLTPHLVAGIAKDAARRGLAITSVHNYCPIPPGLARKSALPDCYSLASPDTAERRLAIKFSRKGIDTALRLGAKAVVLHCGRVGIEDKTRALIRLWQQGDSAKRGLNAARGEFLKARQTAAGKFLPNALKSLEELNRYACRKKILLGVENRFYLREIPAFEEIALILREFKGGNIFYWHDNGHAQVAENLGVCRHRDFLDAYAGQMAGMHLHDLKGCADHQAPGKGGFNFALLKPYLKKETLKVIEAHKQAAAGELIYAKSFLERLFDETGQACAG
jgi:sugar phosphate isomerase/epimerase